MFDLKDLAEMTGIASEYIDKTGLKHLTSDEVRKCFLKDMGYPCETQSDVEQTITAFQSKLWRRGVDYVHAFFTDEENIKIKVYLPIADKKGDALFEFEDEQKNIIKETVSLNSLPILERKVIDDVDTVLIELPILTKLTEGYYNVCFNISHKKYHSLFIIAKRRCFLLDGVAEEKFKVHGVAAQLYALRSQNNMGIGDFTDLKDLIRLTAQNGGDVVGVNPLGILFPESRDDVSPYRALSRAYVNYIYVDLKAVPEYQKSPIVQALVNSEYIQNKIESLRSLDQVDYYGVFQLKKQLLKAMFEYFKTTHLENGLTDRGQAFLDFVELKGEKFRNLRIFEALVEKYSHDGMFNDFHFWPYDYDDIHSVNTKEFADKYYDLIMFFGYCHWLADMQLKEASDLCKTLNMKIGLYLDSPIGASSSGEEVWESRESFAENMGIGAPADPMCPRGQSWGFSPFHPQNLRVNKYASFIHVIRENMRYAGALRLDHAMGLMRLFWIFFEPDNPVVQGAYVYYNMDELLAILSIESHRSHCMLIGEDLGTVPAGFREKMFEHGLLSNQVLYEQKNDDDGRFILPENYRYLSLTQTCTHDQSPINGYWVEKDIETLNHCQMYVNEEQHQTILKNRAKERENLLELFTKYGSFYNEEAKCDAYRKLDGTELPIHWNDTVTKFMADCPCAIYLERLEDIYGQFVMENVPGTVAQYPNWRIKLSVSVDDMAQDGRFEEIFRLLKKCRS